MVRLFLGIVISNTYNFEKLADEEFKEEEEESVRDNIIAPLITITCSRMTLNLF